MFPRILLVTAVAGLCVSVVLQAIAFEVPSGVPTWLYSITLYAAVITLIAARVVLPNAFPLLEELPRVRTFVYRVMEVEGLAWTITFFVLISPQPGNPVQGFEFARPFSVWSVTASRYNAIYFGWLMVMSAYFFSMVLVTGEGKPKRVTQVPVEPKKLPKLLRKSGLLYLFLPPFLLFVFGIVLGDWSLITRGTEAALVTCSEVWGLFALLVAGIALIVSGLD